MAELIPHVGGQKNSCLIEVYTFQVTVRFLCLSLIHILVVRLRDIPPLIGGGIRITVGTREENDRLLEVLHELSLIHIFGIIAGIIVASIVGIVYALIKKDKLMKKWSVVVFILSIVCLILPTSYTLFSLKV